MELLVKAFILVAIGVAAWLAHNNLGTVGLSLLLSGAALHFLFTSQWPLSKQEAKKRSREKAKQTITRRMRGETYPPPFANGWYKVCNSRDLNPGEMMEVEMLGHMLAVFRATNTQEVGIMDAYCPHMGANLTKGGRVVGDCIECPFHLFQFNTDAKCVHIPYQEKIPEAVNNRKWTTHEYNGLVAVWYDAEGRDPHYFPPSVEEVNDGRMVHRGSYQQYVAMHLQEFAENSADFQHFQPLHGQMHVPFTEIPIPGLTIQHSADWYTGEGDESWKAIFKDHAYLVWRGTRIPKSDGDAQITFVGAGGIVYFRFFTPIGDINLYMTHTPTEPLLLDVQFEWYADKRLPRLLVSYIVGNWIAQWKRDVMVWENKRFANRPALVKGDGPIMKLRRWYQQFYSENSKKLRVCDALDW